MRYLGGEPTTTPRPFEKPHDIKSMIELNVQMETDDVTNYLAHARLAEELELPDLSMRMDTPRCRHNSGSSRIGSTASNRTASS